MKIFTYSTLFLSLALNSFSQTALACTTWVTDTDYGIVVSRSVDWGTRLGAIAKFVPAGIKIKGLKPKNFKNQPDWVTKFPTLTLEEHELFHGTSVTSINLEGLSSNGQYMEESKPYLSQYKDNGAPAVALGQVTSYIAQNYSKVSDVKNALEKGEFQIAWSAGLAGSEHGVHFSVQDKTGDLLLIQLNKGGEVALYFNDKDLVSMTNAPLQPKQREYLSKFNMVKSETITEIPADISSKDRNVRLLYFAQQANFKGLSWQKTEGKIQGIFDSAVLVPQDVKDPKTKESYATWVSWIYNLDSGSFKFRNNDTYRVIRFNYKDLKKYKKIVCADLVKQADEGRTTVKWDTCQK